MADLLDRFCDEYHAYNGISRARRAVQRRALQLLQAHAGGDLTAVTGAELTAYLAQQITDGLAPTTVRKTLGAVRPFFHWAWRNGLIDAEQRMQIMDVKPPRGSRNGIPRPYSYAELRTFWADLDEQHPRAEEKYVRRWRNGSSQWKRVQSHAQRLQLEAIVSLCLYGGLRRDEILRLEFQEMHPENDAVVARARKNKDGVWVARSVPMFEPMQEAIAAWYEFRGWMEPDHDRPWLSLWRNYRLQPVTERSFRLLLTRLGRGWEFHRFRHTAATELLRARMPIEKVQLIMGHATVQQTLAYTQLLKADVMEAARIAERRYVQNIERTKKEREE